MEFTTKIPEAATTFKYKTNSLHVIRVYLLIAVVIFSYGTYYTVSSIPISFLLLLAGLVFFTFAEYIIHRFVYHSGDDYMDEKNWQFKVHGIHHSVPRDKHILALPLFLGVAIASALFILMRSSMGEVADFFFPGFMLGYASYLYIHYKVHTSKPPNNLFKHLWAHHLKHHYREEDKAYGVSSPLWDFIFGTMPAAAKSRAADKYQKS